MTKKKDCLECGRRFEPGIFKHNPFCTMDCQIRWTIKDELKKQNYTGVKQ